MAVVVAFGSGVIAPAGGQAGPGVAGGDEPSSGAAQAARTDTPSSFKVGKRTSPQPSADPVSPVDHAFTTFVSRQGYQLRVPGTWRSRTHAADGAPGASIFQIPSASGTSARFVMSITMGSRAGRLTVCDPGCRTIRATTLTELGALLRSAPDALIGEQSRPIQLGGEDGVLEAPARVAWLPRDECGPNALSAYHAFAFHGGRPVVIRIDYCGTQARSAAARDEPSDLVSRILDSFRFID
jgi:hypothetical protein